MDNQYKRYLRSHGYDADAIENWIKKRLNRNFDANMGSMTVNDFYEMDDVFNIASTDSRPAWNLAEMLRDEFAKDNGIDDTLENQK